MCWGGGRFLETKKPFILLLLLITINYRLFSINSKTYSWFHLKKKKSLPNFKRCYIFQGSYNLGKPQKLEISLTTILTELLTSYKRYIMVHISL